MEIIQLDKKIEKLEKEIKHFTADKEKIRDFIPILDAEWKEKRIASIEETLIKKYSEIIGYRQQKIGIMKNK